MWTASELWEQLDGENWSTFHGLYTQLFKSGRSRTLLLFYVYWDAFGEETRDVSPAMRP